ncbi:MAG: hypothetical protein K8R99_03995 [Actinomycetia bacterium]|nr:hypothetical protein [Actinomycetes bacterium]
MTTVLLVALPVLGVALIFGVLWLVVLRPMVRRSNEWVTTFDDEVRLTGETVIKSPESAIYCGGTKPHSSVKGNGRIALTNRRLVFRKLTGPVEEVLVASIIGSRQAAWFRGERRGGRLHFVVEMVDAGEVGFFVRDISAWEQAVAEARASGSGSARTAPLA